MRGGQIKFAHYYEYLSGSIILRLGDGFLRIAVLWCKEAITYFKNKLFLLARKKSYTGPTSEVELIFSM
jgi:hypothetical protein